MGKKEILNLENATGNFPRISSAAIVPKESCNFRLKKKQQILKEQEKKHPLGICFSGGAARGYAHIGILRALTENGKEPGIISGTSMGALVGALYAAGYTPAEIEEHLAQESVYKLLGFSWQKKGLLKMDKLAEALSRHLPEDSFEALKKPFYLAVTNLNEGKTEIRNSGPLYEYLIATCSAPIVFAPRVINEINYVDGGLMCNLPAFCIREKCETLIGSHVNFPGTKEAVTGFGETLERTVVLAINQNAKGDMDLCDHLIDPPELQNYSLMDFKKTEEIIEVGYRYAMEWMEGREW